MHGPDEEPRKLLPHPSRKPILRKPRGTRRPSKVGNEAAESPLPQTRARSKKRSLDDDGARPDAAAASLPPSAATLLLQPSTPLPLQPVPEGSHACQPSAPTLSDPKSVLPGACVGKPPEGPPTDRAVVAQSPESRAVPGISGANSVAAGVSPAQHTTHTSPVMAAPEISSDVPSNSPADRSEAAKLQGDVVDVTPSDSVAQAICEEGSPPALSAAHAAPIQRPNGAVQIALPSSLSPQRGSPQFCVDSELRVDSEAGAIIAGATPMSDHLHEPAPPPLAEGIPRGKPSPQSIPTAAAAKSPLPSSARSRDRGETHSPLPVPDLSSPPAIPQQPSDFRGAESDTRSREADLIAERKASPPCVAANSADADRHDTGGEELALEQFHRRCLLYGEPTEMMDRHELQVCLFPVL